ARADVQIDSEDPTDLTTVLVENAGVGARIPSRAVLLEVGERPAARAGLEDVAVGDSDVPELPRCARRAALEKVGFLGTVTRGRPPVSPDLQIPEHVLTPRELVDRRRLAVRDDHPTGVLAAPVVGRVGQVQQLQIARAVSRPQWIDETDSLPAFPELLLEDLALVLLAEQKEEVLFIGENDRPRNLFEPDSLS